MSQAKFVGFAQQAIDLLSKVKSVQESIARFPDCGESAAVSRKVMLIRLSENAEHQARSLFIKFGHDEAALSFLASHIEPYMIEFYREQAADEKAYKLIVPTTTDEQLTDAALLEIEEMLSIVSAMVGRIEVLAVAWPEAPAASVSPLHC